MIEVDKKYMEFLRTVLNGIERELDRLYWNKMQEELISPFCNTGTSYSNDTFTVRAYNWASEGEDYKDVEPNFEYKGFKLYWYKYLGRGMSAVCDVPVDAEFIYQMHEDCIHSLKKDFEDIELEDE